MGNTPTKDKQQHDMYAAYIQRQQVLIMQQQQQINSLFQFGLDSQQTPQNIVFQNQQPQMGHIIYGISAARAATATAKKTTLW